MEQVEQLSLKLRAAELKIRVLDPDEAAAGAEAPAGAKGEDETTILYEMYCEKDGEIRKLEELLDYEKQHSADLVAELEQQSALHTKIVASLEQKLGALEASSAARPGRHAPTPRGLGAAAAARATPSAGPERKGLEVKIHSVALEDTARRHFLCVDFFENDPVVTPIFEGAATALDLAMVYEVAPDDAFARQRALESHLEMQLNCIDGGQFHTVATARIPVADCLRQLSAAGHPRPAKYNLFHDKGGTLELVGSIAYSVFASEDILAALPAAPAAAPADKLAAAGLQGDGDLGKLDVHVSLLRCEFARAFPAAARLCVAYEIPGPAGARAVKHCSPYVPLAAADEAAGGPGARATVNDAATFRLADAVEEIAGRSVEFRCFQDDGRPGGAEVALLGAARVRLDFLATATRTHGTFSLEDARGQPVGTLEVAVTAAARPGTKLVEEEAAAGAGAGAAATTSTAPPAAGAAGLSVAIDAVELEPDVMLDAAVRNLFVMLDSEAFHQGADDAPLRTRTALKTTTSLRLGYASGAIALKPAADRGAATVSFCVVAESNDGAAYHDLGYAEMDVAPLLAPDASSLPQLEGRLAAVDAENRRVATLLVRVAKA